MAKGKTLIEHNGLSWSPDGKGVMVSYTREHNFNAFKIPNPQHQIVIWDVQNGTLNADFSYSPTINNWNSEELRFSSDGKTLVGEGVPPARYDAATGRRLNYPAVPIYTMAFENNVTLGLRSI